MVAHALLNVPAEAYTAATAAGVVPLSPEELAALRLEREKGGQGADSDEGWQEGAEVQSIFD